MRYSIEKITNYIFNTNRDLKVYYLLIFLSLLISRIIFLLIINTDGVSGYPDTYRYIDGANNILKKDFNLINDLFIPAPLHYYLIAFFINVFGVNWIIYFLVFQTILFSISGVYLFKISLLIFSKIFSIYIFNIILNRLYKLLIFIFL